MKDKIKLFDPVFGKEEERALLSALKSKFWASGAGSGNVGKFEEQFRKYIGTKACIAVNNGTSALHLALSLLNIKGKEVILPSLSFVSTAHAILYNGGKPVFVDIDPITLCIDHTQIEEQINSKTSAVMPVHFAGFACNLDSIRKTSNKHRVSIIEDAAHAAGTVYKNKKIGTHGEAVCFSFHPVKNLAMPTGGAITLNGKEISSRENTLKIRRWCGISNRHDSSYDITQLGWNFYMNEFSAAIGIEQLKKLDLLNKNRKKIAKRYHTEIKIVQKMPYDDGCSYHFYWICVKNRERFMQKMNSVGIETGIHYRPIHTMSMYQKYKAQLPNTTMIGNSIVSLPTHLNLTDDDISRIIDNVNKFSS